MELKPNAATAEETRDDILAFVLGRGKRLVPKVRGQPTRV